jgi:hypothetical protein
MWPELYALLIIPTLALIAVADSLAHSSAPSHVSGRKSSEVLLCLKLFVALCALIFAVNIAFNDHPFFAIIEYRDISKQVERNYVEKVLGIIDVALVLTSSIAAFGLSFRWKKNPVLWLLATILGNVGALVWLVRNSQGVARGDDGERHFPHALQ